MSIARDKRAHNFVDMTGMTVGRLKVIEFAGIMNKAAQWVCECYCGNLTIVSRPALLSTLKGRESGTKSCGCSRKTGKGSRPRYTMENTTLQSAMNQAYKSYKVAAQKRNLEFSLTKNEFHAIVKQNCHYCGSEPSMIKKSNAIHREVIPYTHNGIDRKDNLMGYSLDNSLPCCSICNHAKHTLNYDEFKEWIIKASDYIKQCDK